MLRIKEIRLLLCFGHRYRQLRGDAVIELHLNVIAAERLDVGVENLLDKFYYQPTGGAYTGQGTTMSINGIPWGIGVPGMGRSIYAGVNVKF